MISTMHCVSKMPRASQCNARNKRFDVDFTAEESIWKWRSKTNLFKWQSNILQRGFPMDPIFYCTMWHKYNNFGTFIPTEILVNFCRCSTWHDIFRRPMKISKPIKINDQDVKCEMKLPYFTTKAKFKLPCFLALLSIGAWRRCMK